MLIRDRIRAFLRVRAGDLRPHPHNWRTHPTMQQNALRALLAEVGYAGALLARELADGSLELIDGHLRAETTPDQLVPVLVLDVTEQEALKLLAFFDPLSTLAGRDDTRATALAACIETDHPELEGLLRRLRNEPLQERAGASSEAEIEPSYQIVVQCADESEQRALFTRFSQEGLACRVLTM